MKNPKNLASAIALTLALGLSAFAGETHCPPAPPPPPGEMQGPGFASTGQIPTPPEANASFAELAVSVLESLLPLF
jgi:hypothetical protein